MRSRIGTPGETGDQTLETLCENVRLTDLIVFGCNLLAQEFVVAFEKLNIAVVNRGQPRLFATGRERFAAHIVFCFCRTNGRVRPRLFASVRLASFHDHGDVSIDRSGRDQISFAVGRFDLLGFEIAASAIFLDGANRSRVAGRRVAIGGLLNGQEVSVFVAGRGWPRLFGHERMVPPGRRRPTAYPHARAGKQPNGNQQREARPNRSAAAYRVRTRKVCPSSAGSGEMPVPSLPRYSMHHSNA